MAHGESDGALALLRVTGGAGPPQVDILPFGDTFAAPFSGTLSMRGARENGPPEHARRDRDDSSVDRASRSALGVYTTAGLQFGVVLLLFAGLGYWLDMRLHTLPILTIVGAAAGGIGGFIHLYRSLT